MESKQRFQEVRAGSLRHSEKEHWSRKNPRIIEHRAIPLCSSETSRPLVCVERALAHSIERS
jgi:hypothetical protein